MVCLIQGFRNKLFSLEERSLSTRRVIHLSSRAGENGQPRAPWLWCSLVYSLGVHLSVRDQVFLSFEITSNSHGRLYTATNGRASIPHWM